MKTNEAVLLEDQIAINLLALLKKEKQWRITIPRNITHNSGKIRIEFHNAGNVSVYIDSRLIKFNNSNYAKILTDSCGLYLKIVNKEEIDILTKASDVLKTLID